MQIDLTQKPEPPKEDLSLKFTKEIVAALKGKMRDFNSISTDKVSFEKLKNLFVLGASKECDCSLVLCGFARVNMFLRLLKDKAFLSEFKADGNKDFSPKEVDFGKASEDLKKYNIDFTISNIEELYFADVNEISFLQAYL